MSLSLYRVEWARPPHPCWDVRTEVLTPNIRKALERYAWCRKQHDRLKASGARSALPTLTVE